MTALPHPRVPLGKLLTQVSRSIPRVSDDFYRPLGVKWYANGLFFKELTKGNEIRAARLYRVEDGDFIYNRLFAWKGSFALAGPEHAGCVVSNEFPTFRANQNRLLPKYLMAFFSRPALWDMIAGQSSGTAEVSRLRLKEADFLRLVIPLPSLAEQARIVKLLDEAAELRKLRAQADSRTAILPRAIFHEMFGEPSPDNSRWPSRPLKRMGKLVTGNTPPRKNAEFYGTFIEWIKTDNIHSTTRTVEQATERLSQEGAARGRIVPEQSVLITCIAGSRDRIGDAAVTDRPVAINQQINAIVPDSETDSIFLCELVMALKPVIQHKATGVMTGIINKSALEEIEGIHPPLLLQRQFATCAVETRLTQIDQATSRRRLDDLFHSLLHQAFTL